MQDEDFMCEAIRLSRLAVEHGNEPFGAILVKDAIAPEWYLNILSGSRKLQKES